MKKTIALLLMFLLTATSGLFAGAEGFTDLTQDHWAYQDIMTLVAEGTVNGYEDGSFQPAKTVTRAEFVKMLGKWDRAYEGTFSDLPSGHWAYDYIVWSGLEPEGDRIYPDREILRSEVVNLIWKRNGSPANSDAPYAISKQGTNEDAASWAYTIGLVQGDDGYNLHLDRPLTRAEAAALIVRSKSVVAENGRYNFADIVDESLLQQVYQSTGLFEGVPFAGGTTVTYGQLARAAMTLGAGGKPITYDSSSLDTDQLFDHVYTKDLYVLANKLWGAEYYTLETADKNATVQDCLSALVYGLVRRGGKTVNLGKLDAYYSDCTGADSTTMENLCLSYAAGQGIKLTAGAELGAAKEATLRDVAALLLQLDEAAGLDLSYAGDAKYNVKMNKDLAAYPQNYADYRFILEDVPLSVYSVKPETAKPVEYYRKANQMSFVFTAFLTEVENLLKNQQDVNVSFTYYPSLTYEDDGSVVFIVKCTPPASSGAPLDLDTVFSGFLKEKTGLAPVQNKEFYVAFKTYEPIMDIYLPSSAAYIETIIIPD